MNTADLLVYIHPELNMLGRSNLERMIESQIGVDCAQFDHFHNHAHAMIVKYDPDSVTGIQILDIARRVDPSASIVGL